jgi:NAD(P)-dependent dehydrogenase (short-subunit alcohol dehydrogenase family)
MALQPGTDLSGRVVLVTGGGRGVGLGICQAFLGAGATVFTCGRHEPAEEIGYAGRTARFVRADVRDPDQAAGLVDEVVAAAGGIDVAVNNAGGAPYAEAGAVSPGFVNAVVGLNLLGPFYVAQRANHHMQDQADGGCVLNISSVSAQRPSPGTALYGAAKAGLASLTRSLAVEWAPKVRVNTVTAGMVRTEETDDHYGDADSLARVTGTIPLGRMAEPGDVGAACVFLASPSAAYISGADLAVHGGGEPPVFLYAAHRRDR